MSVGNDIRVIFRGDDPEVRWLFAREIRRLGYRLVEAPDRGQVLEELTRDNVALVILEDDPEDNEILDLVSDIRDEYPATEIILYTDSASPQRGFQVGRFQVTAYLIKPFSDAGPLDRLFESAISRYRLEASGGMSRERLEQRMKALAKLLDRMPMGIVLVDARRMVLLSNQIARGLLQDGDGVKISEGGKLEARAATETAVIQRLVEAALPGPDDGYVPTGGATTISRGRERQPLNLMVGPLEAAVGGGESTDPVVAVVVTDPDQDPEPRMKILRRLYDLSPRQAAFAVKLMQGKTMEEAAEALHVSINTAKTHMKALYRKTNTSRQAELVSMLWSSPVSIRLGNQKREDEE